MNACARNQRHVEGNDMRDIVTDTSPASLARANLDNLAEGLAACARAYGGEVYDEPDLLLALSGIPAGGWNRVTRTHLTPETADARIKWVIERAQALHLPFLWMLDPSTRPAGLELDQHLTRHGFTYDEEEAAMGVALARFPVASEAPEGVTIERVADRAALEQWARTMSAGFGAPPSLGEVLAAAASRDGFGDGAAAHFYLAQLHGEPVATSALALAGGVAGVLAVSTIEAARRRGIGAAVTLAPLLAARSRGYHVGVLQASEMGYPVYAKMGFTEQFRYRAYRWRPQ
jgi:GNAT superfamily N-acetyltransferase